MTWDELHRITNRSAELVLDWKKLLFTFCMLLLGGWIILACRTLAINAGSWAALCLTFLPIFVTIGLLMGGGVILTRVYHDQVKQRPVDYSQVAMGSWQIIVTAFSLNMLILFGFVVLWMALGIFHLFIAVPLLGPLFSVILAFGPFLLYVTALILVIGAICMTFFVTPILALRAARKGKISQTIRERLKADIFSNTVQVVIALLPLLLSLSLGLAAGCFAKYAGFISPNPFHASMQWFFILIPFMALVTPATVFFFNLAFEAHVLAQTRLRENDHG